jgi:hypothetical protein
MKPERHNSDPEDRQPAQLRSVEASPDEAPEEPLKCVWSGYPAYERDCRSRIPASVVIKAWQREMQLKGTVEGFFNFSWRSGVWLGFGLPGGGVRGVYCPTHCSERDSRGTDGEEPTGDGPEGIALQ